MSNIYVIAVDEQVPRVNASACTITGRCVETTVALPDSSRGIAVSLVLGGTDPVYWRSKSLHIFSQLLVPDWSAVRRWNFTYNWTVVDTSSGVAVHSIGRSNDPSLLTFPSFSLLADGTYQAVVSLVEVGITSPPVVFSVTADPIAVVLQPSQRTHYVAAGDTIRFDASKSYDANNDIGARSGSALSFAWQCVDDPASLCQVRSTALAPLNSIVDISVAERAVAGAMFRLRVVVRHRTSNRQADATVLIVVQAKGTPRVDLVANSSVLSWRNVPMSTAVVWAVQAHVNRSSCLDSTACGLSWSMASSSGGGTFSADMKSLARVAAVQASSTLLSQIITFHPSSFATGVLYTFRVALGTQLALAELDIAMNRPPFGGILDVTPRSGVAMQTTFHLAAYGWKDDASSDYPLTYDYRYFVLNQWWQLINPSALPFVEATRLPWNTSVSVRVTVADMWSAASTAFRSVSLTKIADDRWQLSSYWQLINATYPTTTVWLRQGGLVLVDVRSQYAAGLFRAVTLIPLVTALQSKVNETVVRRTDPSMLTMGQALVSNINLFRLELQLQAARDQVYNDLFASSSSTNASAQGSLDQATKAFDSLTPLLLGMLTAGTSTAGSTTVNTVTISTGGMTASFSVISFGSPSSSSSSDNSSAPSSVSLSIPNSANSISLSTTAGAETAGVVVSLVQLDASSLKSSSFLPANATANGTTGGNAAAAALTQAKLSSDIITIQLISASTNGSQSSLALPTFDASLTLTSSTTNTPDTGPTTDASFATVVAVIDVVALATVAYGYDWSRISVSQRRPGTIGGTIPPVVSSVHPLSASSPPMDAPSTSVAMPSRGRRAAISVMPVVLAVGPSTNAATTTSSASQAPPSSGRMLNAHHGGVGGGGGGGGAGGGSGHSTHLALASDAEFGVSLMHVVVADAIETLSGSREKRNIVLHTIRRSYAEMYFVHEAWQYVFMVVLLVMNGGAFYFIISKAAMRGMNWQFAFLRACSLEWFTEIFLIEVLECLLLDFALAAYVHHEVLQCVAMFVHLQAMHMGQKQRSQQQPRQQSSVVPEDAVARRGWSSLPNEALRASDSPLVALALLRPNVKESRFALVCHDYMASLRAVRHGSVHGGSSEEGAPSELPTTMSRWTRWCRTLRRTLRRGLRRVFDWYCRRSAGTQETILNVSTSVLVAVSIFLWFAVVQPALVGGNLIAASVTWLVVLGGGLYVAARVLFAMRRAQPTLITPWTDPVDTASTDTAVLREAEAAKRTKEQEALPHEVKLDDEDDSGDHDRSLDGDVDVRSRRPDARSALDAVVRHRSDASSWLSLDAASWSNFSRSDGSADGIADGIADDDEADKDDGSEDGRDSPVSNDSQQWAALFASTSPSSGSAASHHRDPQSSPPASLDRQWSLSQSNDEDEGGEDPKALLFDDWDDDVDAPLHRTPTGKASASSSGVVSSRFSFD
eukprot:gene7640-5493_t